MSLSSPRHCSTTLSLLEGSSWQLASIASEHMTWTHDDVIKWKLFPCYWPFVQGIHRSPVNSPHKGQWRRALMFSLICTWINDWVNNGEAGDLRRYCTHYDVTVMSADQSLWCIMTWRGHNELREIQIVPWSFCLSCMWSQTSVITKIRLHFCISASFWYWARHLLISCDIFKPQYWTLKCFYPIEIL